jgi:hypothetical protein
MRFPVAISASATNAEVMPAPMMAMSQSMDSSSAAFASPMPLRSSQYASLERTALAEFRLKGHMLSA